MRLPWRLNAGHFHPNVRAIPIKPGSLDRGILFLGPVIVLVVLIV